MYSHILKCYRVLAILLVLIIILSHISDCHKRKSKHPFRQVKHRTTKKKLQQSLYSKRYCMDFDRTLKAKHKSCFLRPDTGPCRADIIQWYFDIKQSKCYRYFWGGCQGNGNRFATKEECENFCVLETGFNKSHVPNFCKLAFDYGNCFGYYHRYTWDTFTKSCRRRIYSGCGGNQNNFETRKQCINTCLVAPNNTFQGFPKYTTCIAFHVAELA